MNVRNAAWVLSLMWQKQDLRRSYRGFSADLRDGFVHDDYDDYDDDFDWIQELDDARMDWLFI